jgi:Holliday junction resolvase RusA-like endonuclease
MMRIHLDILPPTVNEMYKRSRTSFYKSAEAKQAIEAVQWLMKSQYRGKPIKTDGISVSVNMNCKNKLRDIDGMLKSLLDCGNGILWTDDKLISELHVFKLKGKDTIDLIIDHQSVP